ncbi:MAG: histidine phosphatase family protein [Paracoccaceae bacterium]|nr:histidine phosphatase family protein [Paracoccaceae bacterium]
MSRTLILMRHAKSAWDDASLDDFDRPLNDRGRRSAPAIADWLVQLGHLPDVVLVSGARRTVETWQRMAKKMPETATMESAPALYLASPDTILNVLKSQAAQSIMMIGHNPGIAEFAARIVSKPPDHPKFESYPTAAATIINFDIAAWSDVTWASGTVQGFVVPRELID